MASTLNYTADHVDLQSEIKGRNDSAELSKREKYIAARKIQAWIRGIITRNHLRTLHWKATIIQRNWRGHRVRSLADRYVMERVEQMWLDHYDRMAAKIQAAWRGYRVRKTGVDFRKMRQWLRGVYERNRALLEDMKKFREKEIERVRETGEQESMQWILHILFKLHHLLRTKQRPGVITRIDQTQSTSIEEMLRCLEYQFYVSPKKSRCEECEIPSNPTLVFRGTRLERCEREIRDFQKSLNEGHVPIYRSEPYEVQERARKETIHLGQRIVREKTYDARISYGGIAAKRREIEERSGGWTEANGRSCKPLRKSSCSTRKTNLQSSCLDASEIYDMLRQMDCHQSKPRLNRPCRDLNFNHSSSR